MEILSHILDKMQQFTLCVTYSLPFPNPFFNKLHIFNFIFGTFMITNKTQKLFTFGSPLAMLN